MNKKTYRYLAIGLFLLAIGIFFTALHFLIKNKKEIHKHGLSTSGVLFDVKGEYLKVRYTIGDEILTFGTSRPFRHLQNGEEYVVKYMESDPDYISVYYSKPIFSDSYEYGITKCNSLSKKQSLITFNYIVDGKNYVRQKQFKTENSVNQNDYIIKYRTDNPKIGYLVKKE